MTHHHHCDGWITLAKKENNSFKQCYIKLDEVEKRLNDWSDNDAYFSQNTFFVPSRSIDTLRQLRYLYADIDCYKLGFLPIQVLSAIEYERVGISVPNPNSVIFSGRGLVLQWRIEPAPYKALPLWQAIQNHFYRQLVDLGADSNSLDAARVFRIAGSINTKSNEIVKVQMRHDYEYSLRELQEEYLPDLSQYKSSRKNSWHRTQWHNSHQYNLASLHRARLEDLRTLLKLRDYDVEGYREQICFLYRYWSNLFIPDPREALRQTLELNKQFIKPLPERELITATKNVEKKSQERYDEAANHTAQHRGYKHAGYNFSNEQLIQRLNITENEQQHLKTIISKEEKYDRNNRRRNDIRRELGKLSRDEYIASQKNHTRQQLLRLEQEMKNNPRSSNYRLADLLEVSEGRIRALKKLL